MCSIPVSSLDVGSLSLMVTSCLFSFGFAHFEVYMKLGSFGMGSMILSDTILSMVIFSNE